MMDININMIINIKGKSKHCTYCGIDASGKDNITFSLESQIDNRAYKCDYDHRFSGRTNMHYGQRKLLISEIQLLSKYYTDYGDKGDPVVLYIGDAPGMHLITLHHMFPRVKFILYDSARFESKIMDMPHVFQVHNEYFTEESCNYVKDIANLLLVSDIRRNASEQRSFEDGVMQDMMMQQQWVKTLRPVLSLLKFRMSYNMKTDYSLTYLKGTLYFGIWAKRTSGECRLLVDALDGFSLARYGYSDYERTQAYHNRYVRSYGFTEAISKFQDLIIDKGYYCPCYDCFAEMSVIKAYAAAPIPGKLTMLGAIDMIMSDNAKLF